MKRFHVHAHVADLEASIAFYSKLFAAEPTRVEPDYAKWMLDDPRINFAISTRGGSPGVDHLGIQAETDEELGELKRRAQQADLAMLDQGEASCCYARSDKYWLVDPQGIAWEQYRTLENIPVFGESTAAQATSAACCATGASESLTSTQPAAASCAPASRGKPIGIPVTPGSSCC
jgi:catechol 2,3-dioxygenase-like lactoylglutathione lyase family enzyme